MLTGILQVLKLPPQSTFWRFLADGQCEVLYQPEGWGKAYRFVALRYAKEPEPREADQPEQYQLFDTPEYTYRVFVTNMDAPLDALVGFYRGRASAENLNSNVTNPFCISNFASLQTSDPLVYRPLAAQSFFTSPTIQKNRLLRPFPQMNRLNANDLPMRKVRVHSLDVMLQRRFSRGFSLNFAFAANRAEEWSTIVNEYDKAPTQWLTSGNARPYRVTANGIYEFPVGKGRAFLREGVLGAIAGGWQTGSTFEWQPGPLLS